MRRFASRTEELIQTLNLRPHPERGYFAQTYRAPLVLDGLPHGSARAASTAIYFLATAEAPATFLHRLKSDELFHLYEGGPLDVLVLAADTAARVECLGLDLAQGQRPQLVLPAGSWFGTELHAGVTHCLWGCTVAPGFEFDDFELAEGPELAARFPEHAERIRRMSRSK